MKLIEEIQMIYTVTELIIELVKILKDHGDMEIYTRQYGLSRGCLECISQIKVIPKKEG
jgi:hypothetical protein